MSTITYPYQRHRGSRPRPMVTAVAVNLITGRHCEFLAQIDSGADRVGLTTSVMQVLGIRDDELQRHQVFGIEGWVEGLLCDFVSIGFMDLQNFIPRFPNGEGNPVPILFTARPENNDYSLLGQDSFLDLCRVKLDGPRQRVEVDF